MRFDSKARFLPTAARGISTSAARRAAMSPETIKIVKSTAPVVAEHGYAITRAMYGRMFSKYPEVKAMFNQGHQVEKGGEKAQQPLTLACAVHAFAQYVDNPAVLSEAIERIAQKHVSLYVLPEQYDIVGENLLFAIKEVLGDAATPEIMAAWAEAYGFLAEVFINRERELREASRDVSGGWEGWRDFVVDKRVKESSIITSFYLKPKDGQPIPTYQPGQYIGLSVTPEGHATTTRNYTLSCRPNGKHFRITVKREEGPVPGVVSTWLHDSVKEGDVLKVGVPCGEFHLIDNDRPKCFISGGVGLTPVLCMVEQLLEKNDKSPIFYLDAVRSQEVEAMHSFFSNASRKHLNFNVKFVYDNPPQDSEYPRGPVTVDHVKLALPTKDCDFYLCGPRGFMDNLIPGLKEWGVPSENIHFEFFGPWDAGKK